MRYENPYGKLNLKPRNALPPERSSPGGNSPDRASPRKSSPRRGGGSPPRNSSRKNSPRRQQVPVVKPSTPKSTAIATANEGTETKKAKEVKRGSQSTNGVRKPASQLAPTKNKTPAMPPLSSTSNNLVSMGPSSAPTTKSGTTIQNMGLVFGH